MVQKIVNQCQSLGSRGQLAVVGVAALVLLGSLVFVISAGGSDSEVEEVPEVMLPESTVHEFVAATIEAYIPTEVPTPTPDVPATVTAERAFLRQTADRVVEVNPLSPAVSRNPFLTRSEVEHLERLGGPMWLNVRLWFLMWEIRRDSTPFWHSALLHERALLLQELMEAQYADWEFDTRSNDKLGPTVVAFTSEMSGAVSALWEGATAVQKAAVVVGVGHSNPLGPLEEAHLLELQGDLEQGLQAFHDFMTSYGCSICGELFRSPGLAGEG